MSHNKGTTQSHTESNKKTKAEIFAYQKAETEIEDWHIFIKEEKSLSLKKKQLKKTIKDFHS